MNSIALLLQAVAALLAVNQSPQALAIASRAIQLNTQVEVMPKISFSIPKNNSIWPNITDLYNTAYIDTNGNYTQRHVGVDIVGEDTSFGDLNGDGFDDAAAIVQRTDNNGTTTFALAAMLNQGGIMFNIADLTLGAIVQVFSHRIVEGGNIVIDMQIDNQPRAIYTYKLFGNKLIKI